MMSGYGFETSQKSSLDMYARHLGKERSRGVLSEKEDVLRVKWDEEPESGVRFYFRPLSQQYDQEIWHFMHHYGVKSCAGGRHKQDFAITRCK